ncbi:hypothetical protein MNV49_003473 [Pseudohyphozyma bogoriensis]|nr:hypothetical protein MNV49_003473 [Pseudohyphozyma bogoriensis]
MQRRGLYRRPKVSWQDENTPVAAPAARRPTPPPAHPLINTSLDKLLDPSPALAFPPLAPKFTFKKHGRNQAGGASTATAAYRARTEDDASVQEDSVEEASSLSDLRKKAWSSLREESDTHRKISGERRSSPLSPSSVPSSSSTTVPRPSASRLPASPLASSSRNEREPPSLSTEGLSPIRHHLRSSCTIEILNSATAPHPVLIDLRARDGEVVVISGDGSIISVFRSLRAGEPLVLVCPSQTYRLGELPTEYDKVYSLSIKFVNGVRSKMPRLSFFTRPTDILTKHTIFSDPSPTSYEITFLSRSTPLVVHVDRRRGLVTLRERTATSGGALQRLKFGIKEKLWEGLSEEDREYTIDPHLPLKVKMRLNVVSEMMRLF